MPVKTSKALRSRTNIDPADQLQFFTQEKTVGATAPARSARVITKQKSDEPASRTLSVVLNRLKAEKTRCVDVETSGLDWKTNHIVGYVITFSPNPDDSYYVPFRHLGTANAAGNAGPITPTGWNGKLAPGEKDLVTALDQPGTILFGHNVSFDSKFLCRLGFMLKPRIEDTFINEALIDELAGRYSLESCAHRHGVQAKKSSEIVSYLRGKFPEIKADKEAMGQFWRLAGDDPVATSYARGDGTTTWQLRDKQMPEIRKPDRFQGDDVESRERVWDVESRLIPVLVRMMVRGLKVNEERFESTLVQIRNQIEVLTNAFPSGFNSKSPNDVRAWMEKHGHTDWPMTAASRTFPNGQPSFSQSWLETKPEGEMIVKVRKYETLASTLNSLKDNHIHNGCVHATFNQLRGDEYGTITGRLSANDPNLQAAPKHHRETSQLYRQNFVPHFGLWGENDYSQIEPRLLAIYSKCKVLLNGYRADPPIDAHTAVSMAMNRNWYNLDENAQKHYRNNYGKRINQTLLTGGGANALINKYKMDPQDVHEKMRAYFREMPEIRALQMRTSRLFKSRGYMLSLLGRRMQLQNPEFDYRAVNRLLQGGNADVIKSKMVEVGEFLQQQGDCGVEMLMNCHDAITFNFDKDARAVYDKCLDIMEDFHSENTTIKLNLPITVDRGEGGNWAEATWSEK